MTRNSNNRRRELLGSAGTAMALLVAGSTFGAQMAAGASINAGTVTANANKTAVSETTNTATVSASIDEAIGGVQTSATSGGITTNTASGNDVLAGATGNAFHNQIDLSTVTGSGTVGGAAALGLATNGTGATISSSATNNAVMVDLTNFSSGSAVNDSNTISATATANTGSTLLTGALRNDFSSTVMGDADTSRSILGVTAADAAAGMIAATRQTSIDPSNSATAADNSIATRITSTADNTVIASPSVSANTIAATVRGNASQSTINIAGDDTPAYAGSAVVTNFQDSLGEGTSSAINSGSSISGTVYSAGLPVNTLTGTLTVENNRITSSASNNMALGNQPGQAGNEILLDDAMSFDGNAPSASFGVARSTSNYSSATTGDLVVQNVQTAMGDGISDRLITSAQTLNGDIVGSAEALTNGSIAVSGNAMTATAQSNAASNRIANGENAAAFAGTAAVSNTQDNNAVTIAASNLAGLIGARVEDGFSASSVASNSNLVSASAYGNQVTQSVDLQGTTLGIGGIETFALTNPANGSIGAMGTVVVGNLQANTNTDVAASQSSMIGVDWLAASDSAMIGSSLTASGNKQEAVAVGSSAGNGLSLNGTTVGSGAGIANYQVADTTSSVQANSTGQVGAFAGDSITASKMVVGDNLQRAIAYGQSSGNALSVTGDTLTLTPALPTNASSTATFSAINSSALSPQVHSNHSVFNRQSQAGDVTATAVSETAFQSRVEGDVAGSTLQTDGNSLVAAAYGTDAHNTASVDANSIDTASIGYASVATVTNAQNVTSADILARASGENVVRTDIYGDAAGTSVSTSENTVQALAYGNRSTANDVSVSATNIDTSVNGPADRGSASFTVALYESTIDASVAAQNAQASSGSIAASLLTVGADPTSAQIRTRIGESITGSSVVSDDNTLAAGATANRAATAVTLDANQLATTAGLQNTQFNSATLSALIGIAGTAGSPGDPGTPSTPVSASGSSGAGTMSLTGDTLSVSGGSVTVTFQDYSFTADEVAYLNGLANVSGATVGGSSVTFGVGSVDTAAFNNFVFNSGVDGSASGDETFVVSGFTIPGTPPTSAVLATPNQGGVTVAIGDDVLDSSVSVSGNSTAGSVLANSATNSVVASATEIAGGSGRTISTAAASAATGDLVLSSVQSNNAVTETSIVYGTFAIDATAGDIVGSSLTVSNNTQRSDAGSNLATNSIDVTATNLSAGSALSNYQDSSTAVSALSDLDVFAPGASTQSTTRMNGNSNTARAVNNEAANTVRLSATNVEPVSAPNLVSSTSTTLLTADHALTNYQGALSPTSATASTQIYNGDAADLTTSGLSAGSIEIADNATTAQSVANLASNAMTVEGSANQGASAGVLNYQFSMSAVSANATTSAAVVLRGDSTAIPQAAAADDATVRITGNTTTAVARGNSAANVLNMDAGATYGTSGAGTPVVDFGPGGAITSFAATGGVLNQQTNAGTVSATSTGATYQVALNGPGMSPTVTGSSASVSGNAVNAEAYGNTASNRIVMTALNSGTPSAAIGNYQNNTGAVTATVTSVSYGVGAGSGTIGGSTFAATGNRVGATAVGNNAVSVIAAGN